MSLPADAVEIRRACKILVDPGSVVELRVIDRVGSIASGYFSELETFVAAAAQASDAGAQGVYVTLNPTDPALLSRAVNRVRTRMGKKDATTSDLNTARRRRLLIDLDARRPSGISSTNVEHDASIQRAREIRDRLRLEGWPDPALADSGNGAHLVYAIDLPPDDNGLVQRVLQALAARHDDPRICVDQTVFNPARITKLYGTAVRKGDSSSERPHRLARVIESPATLTIVPVELLEALAGSTQSLIVEAAAPKADDGDNLARLRAWLSRRGLEHGDEKTDSLGRRIVELVACPFNEEHRGGSAAVGIATRGGWFFGCKHESCKGRDWRALKAKVDGVESTQKALVSARAALPAILAAAETDPGAPLELAASRALAIVRSLDAPAWARARAALRKCKVPLRSLDAVTKPVEDEEPTPADEIEGYESSPDGFYRSTTGPDGMPSRERLTNFTARIAAQVEEDDGVETRRVFEIQAAFRGQAKRLDVPADRFSALGWVLEELGPAAIVFSGPATRDHARVAIQCASQSVTTRRTFTHTGWRELGDEWVYLSGDASIDSTGRRADVTVKLAGALAGFRLPDVPEDPKAAIRASLAVIGVAADTVTIPILAAVYRSVLGPVDLNVWIVGPSGEGKSELAALAQQHFGAGLDRTHLPGSWSSTGNALEGVAFLAKDALFVVDDFAPHGSAQDVSKMHLAAERLLRAQGNGQGRQRMRADATLRPPKPPRGLILGTGEDVPAGFSLRARMAVVELAKGGVDFAKLTEAQVSAARGLYAQSMSAFVRWVSENYSKIREEIPSRAAEVRAAAARYGEHRRTSTTTAHLGLGLDYFTQFAVDAGAMTAGERERLMERTWQALMALGERQQVHQQHAEPASRFVALLAGALAAGRCHVASEGGESPDFAERWGWALARSGRDDTADTWRAQGDRVGWLTAEGLMLDPEASFAAAKRFGGDGAEGLQVSSRTLYQRLAEKGVLVERDAGHATVRKSIDGVRRRVLRFAPTGLWPDAEVADDQRATLAAP